ncbi:MAG: hypothetical protein ABR884_00045 [Minisyncoccia bacterium]|jgi:hypothetical protein
MDTAEQFLPEWERLLHERQRLMGEAEQLRRKLSSLPQELEMKKLLEEKQKLKDEAARLGSTIHFHKEDIEATSERHQRTLKRRRALTDLGTQQGIARQLGERRKRLATLEKLGAPEYIRGQEKRMVFELEAPIEEVGKLYQQMEAEAESEQRERQRAFDEVNESIKKLEEHYRQVRHCLEDALRQAEGKVLEHRTNQVEWSTQSRGHLEWVLKHGPSYKDDIVRRYQVRFPTDNLIDLFPPSPALDHTQVGNGKRRRMRSRVSVASVEERAVVPMPAWRFWLTFNENEEGQELPTEKEKFLACLQTALERAAYPNLPTAKVYSQLMMVTRLKTAQRQQIKRVMIDQEMLGWKIVRAGREHRLFLLIDEEKRHLRFLPRQRKVSYSEH